MLPRRPLVAQRGWAGTRIEAVPPLTCPVRRQCPRPAPGPFSAAYRRTSLRRSPSRSARTRAALRDCTVWNVNSTATGGGVAEMLQVLVGYILGVGVDVRWLVIAGDREFFSVTKRIHNRLHGVPGDGDTSGRARDHHLRVRAVHQRRGDRRTNPARRRRHPARSPDGRAGPAVLKAAGAVVLWRCHVGTQDGRTGGPRRRGRSYDRTWRPATASCSRARCTASLVPPGSGVDHPALDRSVLTHNQELSPRSSACASLPPWGCSTGRRQGRQVSPAWTDRPAMLPGRRRSWPTGPSTPPHPS